MAFDRRETLLLLTGDFLVLVASLWVALLFRNLAVPSIGYFEANIIPFVPVFCISLIIFYIAGLYEKQTRPIRRSMGTRILGAQAATVAIAAILFFVLPLSIAPKTILVLYLIVSVVAESGWRFSRMNYQVQSTARLPALLVGSGTAVHELYDEVNGNTWYRIQFVDRVETAGLTRGGVQKAVRAAVGMGVTIVVLDVSDPHVVREVPALYDLMADGNVFLEFSSLYEEIFDRVALDHVDASQLLETLPRHQASYDVAKRLFDLGGAFIGGISALVFVLPAAFILLIAGGQPFIFQERIGKGGKIVRLMKLRTMLFNDNGNPELRNKNRLTPFGAFLRRTRIDELPQLWNILVGDLSFIGPRPEYPALASVYEREIPYYRMRHLIAPGLSGWAQIRDYDVPRHEADVEKTRRKLSYDLYYLKHRSFGLDLAIALKTFRALFAFSGT